MFFSIGTRNFEWRKLHFQIRKHIEYQIKSVDDIKKHKVDLGGGFRLFEDFNSSVLLDETYNNMLSDEGDVMVSRDIEGSALNFFPRNLDSLSPRSHASKTNNIKPSPLLKLLEEQILWPVLKEMKNISKIFEDISYMSPRRSNRGNENIDKIYSKFARTYKKSQGDFVSKALSLFNIPGEVIIEKIDGVSFAYLKSEKEKNLLSNFGFGFTQLLPIIMEINNIRSTKTLYHEDTWDEWNDINIPRTFILEEPESNLHPNLQSKLADLLFLAYKEYNIQFIVETHSEYLIRRLQYLIAKEQIEFKKRDSEGELVNIKTDNLDVVIYYFNPPNAPLKKREKQVEKIRIMENGTLSKSFGKGFYDEATNMKIELYKINQEQKN